MRISDWSSDVCSSDLAAGNRKVEPVESGDCIVLAEQRHEQFRIGRADMAGSWHAGQRRHARRRTAQIVDCRSEEQTSELKSLMRISYAVFSLTQKDKNKQHACHSLEVTTQEQPNC